MFFFFFLFLALEELGTRQNYNPQGQNYDFEKKNYESQKQNYDSEEQKYDSMKPNYDSQAQNSGSQKTIDWQQRDYSTMDSSRRDSSQMDSSKKMKSDYQRSQKAIPGWEGVKNFFKNIFGGSSGQTQEEEQVVTIYTDEVPSFPEVLEIGSVTDKLALTSMNYKNVAFYGLNNASQLIYQTDIKSHQVSAFTLYTRVKKPLITRYLTRRPRSLPLAYLLPGYLILYQVQWVTYLLLTR